MQFSKLLNLVSLSTVVSFGLASNSNALVIGHYDQSREINGFSDNYLADARDALLLSGHTLVSTNDLSGGFLGNVDAFFTGLITTISTEEVTAMRNFVDTDGGFLFIQQDHGSGLWHGAGETILSNWEISTSGLYFNDANHQTVGSSPWVSSPNLVDSFSGTAHGIISQSPDDFEVLGEDDLGRAILGVFDSGAGRSSDVLVSTDINMWTAWDDERNRQLWDNIWNYADQQIINNPLNPGGGNGGSGSGDDDGMMDGGDDDSGGGDGEMMGGGNGGSGSGGDDGGMMGGGMGGGYPYDGEPVAVSEPQSFSLFGMGLFALWLTRGRKYAFQKGYRKH